MVASTNTESPRDKTRILILFCIAWILPGLVGHDPWKPDEAYTFGLVYHILQSGDWIIPTLAGEPFMEKPPLFYLTAALFAKVFSFILPLHDAARLATGFYIGLIFLFTALAARELYEKGSEWLSVIILIGCLGLLVRGHQLVTDIALLSGFAISLYGFSLSFRRPKLAGFIIGTGVGIGFMSKGLLAPGLIGIIALSLFIFKAWRTKNYLICLAIAFIASLPWIIIWPLLVYLRSPQLFMQWFWVNNFGRYLGFITLGPKKDPGYYLQILPWFAWPALPLALLSLWQTRNTGWSKPSIHLPLVSFLVMLIILSFAADARDIYALPMLLPLSLLATYSVDRLRRSISGALDWFGIMTFGLIALFLWAGWVTLITNHGNLLPRRLHEYLPGFVPEFNLISFMLAVIFSLLWIALIRPGRRSNRRALINWAGGVTLVWLLAMTLWLPLLDTSKSYRGMISGIQEVLRTTPYKCMASQQLGEPQRALLHYFAGIITERIETGKGKTCELLIVQGDKNEENGHPGAKWSKIWEGNRPNDQSERFRLYQLIKRNEPQPLT